MGQQRVSSRFTIFFFSARTRLTREEEEKKKNAKTDVRDANGSVANRCESIRYDKRLLHKLAQPWFENREKLFHFSFAGFILLGDR